MRYDLATYGTPLRYEAVRVARQLVGQREATGNNDGWLPRLVQRWVARGASWLDNQPWCACFATWCVHRAAARVGIEPQMPRDASSSSLYRWAKRTGNLLAKPQPGCIGLVRGGPTGHSHTFIVDTLTADRKGVHGIDGNWRNAVERTRRPISECDFIRIV